MAVETISEANPELSEYNLDDYDEDKPQAQGTYIYFVTLSCSNYTPLLKGFLTFCLLLLLPMT